MHMFARSTNQEVFRSRGRRSGLINSFDRKGSPMHGKGNGKEVGEINGAAVNSLESSGSSVLCSDSV